MDAEERARYVRENEQRGTAPFSEPPEPVDAPNRVVSKTKWVDANQLSGNRVDTHGLATKVDAAVRTLTEDLEPDRVMSVDVTAVGHGYSALVTVVYRT